MCLTDKFSSDSRRDTSPKICRYRPPYETNFDPKSWTHKEISNLTAGFAYCLNLPQIGEAKPGFLFANPLLDDTAGSYPDLRVQNATDLKERLTNDGLNLLDPDQMPDRGHVIAFFQNPKTKNLLYLRRDSNGLWSFRDISEQTGCRQPDIPHNFDNDGLPLKDPFKANLGSCTDFLVLASIPYNGILYKRRMTFSDEAMQPFFRPKPAATKLNL